MVVLPAGAPHTGKTVCAQKLLEKYKYPYLSLDHLKMGLIRSGHMNLTPENDDKITEQLWPIVRKMIKTVIENRQHLIIEGCYIPFDWKRDFEHGYLEHIRYFCLVMSEKYIRSKFSAIQEHANAIEQRLNDNWCTIDTVLEDNARTLRLAREHGVNCLLIDDKYEIDIDV